jgi:uncharacterized membrane protein
MGNTGKINDASSVSKSKKLTTADMALIAILLAVGVVLKFAVSAFIPIPGMKPNFIIASYCLVILLIKPSILSSAVIGLLAGALCQLFPGTPFINFASELIGAVVMCLFVKIPSRGNALVENVFKVAPAAFISTLFSGFAFLGLMWGLFFLGFNAEQTPTALAPFLAIIFGTATTNTIITQALYLPLKKMLKR